ncbi:MAG: hypothetical protein M9921_06000 [Fimbriimonadaceae bacterium]|nr:hypothetical protein [Chthonomonadaceae bacterium]MCO5296392.1 hypothetical protein [Fimbriimonadaceae bacterium]
MSNRRPCVSVFMDVEDPIHLLADDAALELAEVFDRARVRGSFCVTGEKCRVLLRRGREDVVEALRKHCLGLHTDTHSRHPTTMERLADLPFGQGCKAALEAERPGFESFVSAFGRPPAFWGGAGNTWAPEITDALKALGIPAYAYALTQVPEHQVHRFNGVLAFPQHVSVSEAEWADDDLASAAAERVFAALRERAGAWTGLFVGHPTRFRFPSFWDGAFFGGQTAPNFESLEPVAPELYDRARGNLARFLVRLREAAAIEGLDDVTPTLERWIPAGEGERRFFREQTPLALHAAARWPVHRPDLRADGIVEKTLALESTLEVEG